MFIRKNNICRALLLTITIFGSKSSFASSGPNALAALTSQSSSWPSFSSLSSFKPSFNVTSLRNSIASSRLVTKFNELSVEARIGIGAVGVLGTGFGIYRLHRYMKSRSLGIDPVAQQLDASLDLLPEVQSFYRAHPNKPTEALQLLVRTPAPWDKQKDSYGFLLQQGASFFAPSTHPDEINAFTSFIAERDSEHVLKYLKSGNPDKKYSTHKGLLTDKQIKAGIKETLAQMLEKNGFMNEFFIIVNNLCTRPEIEFTLADWQEVLAVTETLAKKSWKACKSDIKCRNSSIVFTPWDKKQALKKRAGLSSVAAASSSTSSSATSSSSASSSSSSAVSSSRSADTHKLCPEPQLWDNSIGRMHAVKLADYPFIDKTYGIFCGCRRTLAHDGSPVCQAGIFRKDDTDPFQVTTLLEAPNLASLAVLIESHLNEYYGPGLCTVGIKAISAKEIEQRLIGNKGLSLVAASSAADFKALKARHEKHKKDAKSLWSELALRVERDEMTSDELESSWKTSIKNALLQGNAELARIVLDSASIVGFNFTAQTIASLKIQFQLYRLIFENNLKNLIMFLSLHRELGITTSICDLTPLEFARQLGNAEIIKELTADTARTDSEEISFDTIETFSDTSETHSESE